jgi:hypothetical protein
MRLTSNRRMQGTGGMRRTLLLTALLLTCGGCVSPKLNNTERLLKHDQFESAVIAAPRFVEDALKTITRLEREIESER